MKTPAFIPQHNPETPIRYFPQTVSESDQATLKGNVTTLASDDFLFTEELQSALSDILHKTNSKYCFAAFINTETAILTRLFLSSLQNFSAQRIDNLNFKKFWEHAFTKNEVVVENALSVYCTISCCDISFRVLRYAATPMVIKDNTIVIIILNKDTDYTDHDLLQTAQHLENLKRNFEKKKPVDTFRDKADTVETIPSLSERIINAQRIESIGVLSGGVAHDFNNYLTGILNFVNLAKLCTVSRQIEQYLNNTIAIINDAQKLTKQFLRYSKTSADSHIIMRVDTILRDNISILLSGTNIRAELHVDDDLSSCEVDTSQIAQLFGSIIINAREAMPDGGFININVHNEDISRSVNLPLSTGKYVKIQISDNGCGIPVEIQSKIFSPYFTTKFRRSGLGLTSAMIIAQSHHGHIAMSSEVNAGSVFTIYLPSADRQKNDASKKNDRTTGGKILLMDDEYFIRQTASEILKKKNFDVVTATQGQEAIELFRKARTSETPFDVVILDLTIPDGMGGMETLKKLAEIDPEVKAIASSGYSDDPVISQPQKYGFAGSLGKPYNLNEFINVIKNVIFREI